jgi:hypothetical protein
MAIFCFTGPILGGSRVAEIDDVLVTCEYFTFNTDPENEGGVSGSFHVTLTASMTAAQAEEAIRDMAISEALAQGVTVPTANHYMNALRRG